MLKKIAISLLFFALLVSVVRSGYGYQLDNDEMSNAQKVFLMQNGYQPYQDFFSHYPPLLHWLITPIFTINGFNFDSLVLARIPMIFLYLVRLIALYLIFKKTQKPTISLLAIWFLLLDSFSTFSAMQIRPDNLMMTLFTLGLLTLVYGFSSKTHLFVSGALFSLSLIALPKVISLLVAVLLALLPYFIFKKRISRLLSFLLGLIIPFTVFCLYLISQNSLSPALRQIFIDSILVNNANVSYNALGAIYQFDNPWIFGFYGKPLNWYFVWILPLGAAIGAYVTLKNLLTSQLKSQNIFLLILLLSFPLSWGSLFLVKSVYVQYYLPVSWLLSLFSAIAFIQIYSDLKIPLLKRLYLLVLIPTFIALNATSVKANLNRAEHSGLWATQYYLGPLWSRFNSQELVFPNILFRLPVTSYITGYYVNRLPPQVLSKFPPIETGLEKYQVPYLYLDDNTVNHIQSAITSEYILSHYTHQPGDPYLWTRNAK